MNDISLYEVMPVEKKNFPIRILLQHNTSGKLAAHWHEHIEMLFFTSGSCDMNCAANSFKAQKGDLVFVNSNELHFFDKSDGVDYICIIINPKFFADVNYEKVSIENIIEKDSVIKNIFEEIEYEFVNQTKGYDLAIKGLVYRLMTYVMRNYKKKNSKDRSLEANELGFKRINCVLDYIAGHYAEKLTTAGLAKKWYLSEYYFCRFFKNSTGQSPMNYINRTRIEKAAVLLENTAENITEVAMRVGFDDVNYFSRTFRKYMNLSPTDYKKLHSVIID